MSINGSARGGSAFALSAASAGSGDARVDALLSWYAWTGGTVTWSDPDSAFDFGASYYSDLDGDLWSAQEEGFGRLGASQRAAVARVLEAGGAGGGFAVEGFTALGVSYAGAGSGTGAIRLANTSDAPTAYAYQPGGGALGGDVWLGDAGQAPVVGNYDHMVLLHEVGHALGLGHSHEGERFAAMPAIWDSPEFTVMTYRAYAGGPVSGYTFEDWGAPQTYMMLDIAALQHLYGADFSVNAGDTAYRWTPGDGRTLVDGEVAIDPGANRIFATVWDGGGQDCYDLRAYGSDVRIDLRPGKHSVFSGRQLADLGGGPNDGYARGNIFNALQFRDDPRSLIENAYGGSGDDRIVGNDAANRLVGYDGADVLEGGAGGDRLTGGAGDDVFVFRGGQTTPSHCDRIQAAGGAVAFERPGMAGGDVIDLRAIDADATRAGNQAFLLGEVGRKGGIWLAEVGDATCVRGNTDGDAAVELELRICDGAVRDDAYGVGEFLL